MLLLLFVLIYISARMYKKRGITSSLIIVLAYLLSTILGIVYKYLYPKEIEDYSCFSMIYYTVCLFIFLIPLIKNNVDRNAFVFPEKSTKILTIIIILGGFTVIYSDIMNFDVGRIGMSWVEQRNDYYQNYQDDIIATTWYDRIASNIRHLMVLSLPLFYYQLSKGNKVFAVLLGVSSLSILANSIMNASRQEFILWLGGAVYSFYMFKKSMSDKTIRHVKVVMGVTGGMVVSLIVAITLSRFGSDTGHDTLSLFLNYSGVQPYNAAQFLEKLNSQAQWGNINFPFLKGIPAIKVINDYINAPFYLNVFGSLVGSFYLDFGYYSIFFIVLYSLFFDGLLSYYKKRKSLAYFYLYFFYCDIVFSGMFYYRYISSERIRMIFLVLILIICFDFIISRRKVCYTYR